MQGRSVAGIILVALGVLFILDELNYLDFGSVVSRYWPLILIVVGFVQIASRPSRPLGGLILVGLGLIFLLERFNRLPDNVWNIIWPFLLIAIGLSLFFPRSRGRKHWGEPQTTTEPRLSRSAVLGGFDERVNARPFLGGTVSAFLGGGKLDFRDAELPPEGADLEANATLGGIEIIVPSTWRVEISGSPFLGGIDNRAQPPAAGAPTLRIKASAFMGGVDVKN